MKTTTRTALLMISVACLAGLAGYFANSPKSPATTAKPTVSIGDATTRLLKLKLLDLNGKEQALSQWKGKVLVINFWAAWCSPCREEIPEFARISQKYAANGVQFVGIGLDSAEQLMAFSRQVAIPYPNLIASFDTIDLVSDLGNRTQGLPFTIVIGKDGRMMHTKLGLLPTADLEKALALALAQPDSP